jgi:hypothetical protein
MANDKDNGSLTERLEQALRDLASEKTARSAFEQQIAAQAAKMEELTNQLQALSQPDRRRILDSVGLKNVSAVPRPIEPIRASAPLEIETKVRGHGPRWAAWKALPRLALWQCVALSINLEPTDRLESAMQSGRQQRGRLPNMGAPDEFFERLAFCKQAISTSGPITPQGPLYVGILQSSKCPVLLRDVAAFLQAADFTMPEQLQALLEPSAAGAATTVESAEDRQDRRLKMCEDDGIAFNQHSLLRLPDGIGKIAEKEGISRQAFGDDVKAALKRRFERQREGK